MRRRLRKQIAVLLVLAAFFSGIGGLVFLIVYEPPPPPPPPPPQYAPLVVREARIFRSPAGAVDLLAVVQNPNANAGVRRVRYAFEVLSGGAVAATVPGETFFLPGQEKPIALLNQALDVPVGSTLGFSVGDPAWVAVSPDFRGPALIVVSRESTIQDGARSLYEVKGVLANESEEDFLTVEVTAVGRDAEGEALGVGRTFIGSLLALELREFTVSWPLPPGAVVSELDIFPEVNVFSPTAVQPRWGTPGREPGPRPGSP